MSNQPQTRTLQSYIDSLPLGLDPLLIGAGLKRVPAASEGVPGGGLTGQALVKNSDGDYDVVWVTLVFVQSVQAGTGISIDDTDPLNPIISTSSSGDVVGPDSSVNERIAVFDGVTGKLIKDGGVLISGLQPADADLTAIAALTSAANKVPYATGAGTWAMTNFTLLGRDIVACVTVGDFQTLLSLTPGVNIQAYDAATAKTNVAQQFTKPQRGASTTLTSGTTITQDLADGNNWDLTLGHNATLANPTNQSSYVKLTGSIDCVQDGTGGRTLAFGSNWYPIGAASAPAAPTGANAKFRIDFRVVSSTRIDFSLRGVGV